jgi:hypothetical protein
MDKKRTAWLEWAAYNMARGCTLAETAEEMYARGRIRAEVDADLAALADHPAFLAALRLGGDIAKLTALNTALLELEGQCHDFATIPRVSGLSARAFHERYYAANHPVIIEDVVGNWPARNKWSMDFLRARFGAEPVSYQRGRSLHDHRDSFVDHSTQASLSEFLQLLEHPDPATAPPYLIAHDKLLDRPPFDSLLDDVVFDPRYFDARGVLAGRVFFWLGGAGTMTPLHRDLGNVYLAQIAGRKLVRMAPSKQLHLVYNEAGYHSEADLDKPDFERYPLLKDAWLAEAIIKPGDLLFIPLGWWHFVKSLDTTISVTGNNFAFPNTFTQIF